ncbi:MAG: hypothetical protein ABJC19_11385 [Gemmatimonadota bacterium]
MVTLRPIVLIALLVARPLTLSAQDPRLTGRFSRETAARITQLLDSASAEELPTEPLILRALEGSTKGASDVRILEVLGRLRGALRDARVALGPGVEPADLTVAAAALQAGVPAAKVAELRKWRGGKPLTAPLGAYLDLVARGMSGDAAWSQISDLAQRRAPDRDYVGLSDPRRRPEEE